MSIPVLPAAHDITRVQYAAYRAWLQGLPPSAIAGHWLSVDPDEVPTDREAIAAMHAVRDLLVQRAHQHGKPALAEAVATPGRSGKGMDRAIDSLGQLEKLGTPTPLPGHAVTLWLAGTFARRLRAAGIDTLGDLMALCNDRGRSWWRQVPRIGPRAACTMVRALQRFAPTLGQLGAHVTGEPLPVPILAAPLQPGTGLAVSLEAMRIPLALNGGAGANRAERDRCRIAADNDYQAVQTWLSLWPDTSHTYRAYRKEAERFLAWAIIERGKAFSSLLSDDCLAYRLFLAQPQLPPRWSGARIARSLPGWRPFNGPLSPRSRRYAEQVLTALCAWLVGRHYLDSNPWEGLPGLRVAGPDIHVDKAVSGAVWGELAAWLDDQAHDSARMRTLRATVLLLRDSGMRCFELAGASCAGLRPATGEGTRSDGLWGELRIVGKREKERYVPISHRAYEALCAHWLDRDFAWPAAGDGPLLAPLPGKTTPRGRAKADAGRRGYGDRGLRNLVDEAATGFRAYLETHRPAMLAEANVLHPHAFRHAFGTHATEAGVPVDVLQSYMGHATPATTALYNKAGARRRRAEIGKLFSRTRKTERTS